MKRKLDPATLVRAMEYTGLPGANGFPPDHAWERTQPICFDSDWQGKNSDAARATQVRVLWTAEILDLEISPEGKRDPKSGMKSYVVHSRPEKLWIATIALPMNILTAHFDPSANWRVNFFRVEGASEPRFYSSWQPTYTPQPNFHVPEAFGNLQFARAL